MPNLVAEQDSIRGVKSSSVAGVTVKPNSFSFNPGAEQKRVPSYDSEGFKTPGTPVLISRDYSCQVGWEAFTADLASIATSFDEFYSIAIAFATVNGNTFNFTAGSAVVNGQNVSFDPLGDTMSIGFILNNPDNVEFGAA